MASPVEPSRAIGAGPSFPLAVAMSATGDQIAAVVRSSGATLSAAGDGPTCAAPAAPSPPAFVRALGSFGSGPAQLNFPTGVGVDAGGNVFVVDRTNHRVCKFGPDGSFLLCWGQVGSGDGEFGAFMVSDGPYGLAIDEPNGRVCVADTVNSRVQCFDGAGNFLLKFGAAGNGPGEFAAEFGLAVDPELHDVYVADTFNHRIQVFDAAGGFLRQWGSYGAAPGQLAYPRGVAVDVRGNVYVAEYDNSRISKFDRLGNLVTTWGSLGAAPGQLDHPQAVALDAAGLVYVADWSNNRVQVFSPAGALVAAWGSAGAGEGQFQGPIGVALDARGQVYVSDHFNHRIEVFAPAADACSGCPSGQCLADRPGACCKRSCTAASDCASGYCSPAGVCDLAPRTGSPHATGFATVLTAYRRGLFVVGGDDPDTNKPTGQIWFSGLEANRWELLATGGYQPRHVLAATYSFASDRLYVLDDKDDEARLTAIDPTGGAVAALGSWPRHPGWDRHFLAVDRDGGLLVASSSSTKKKHAILRIDVRKKPPAVDGVDRGKRALRMEPVIDASLYTLVLDKDGEDDEKDKDKKKKKSPKETFAIVGKPFLELKPAGWDDLGDQL